MHRNRLQYDDGCCWYRCLVYTSHYQTLSFFGNNLLLNVYMYQPELFVGVGVPVDS